MCENISRLDNFLLLSFNSILSAPKIVRNVIKLTRICSSVQTCFSSSTFLFKILCFFLNIIDASLFTDNVCKLEKECPSQIDFHGFCQVTIFVGISFHS